MSDIIKISCRADILRFAEEEYGTKPEYLWSKFPEYAVLRHDDNKKWYAVVMKVQRKKLGIPEDGYTDIMVVKCGPVVGGDMLSERGILPAYHMNKSNWITVLLDGSVETGLILSLLKMSFELTSSRKTPGKTRTENRDWVIPANPRYYDVESGFSESPDGIIIWKQTNNIVVGDTVYIYLGAPVSAIRYKCSVVEVNIPYRYKDENIRIDRGMRLKLSERYDRINIGIDMLKAHGVYSVRSPRGIPKSLIHEIDAMYHSEIQG